MLGAIQSDSMRPGRRGGVWGAWGATKGKKYHIALRESRRGRWRVREKGMGARRGLEAWGEGEQVGGG